VYKEDELGIGDEGGGKLICVPHCPLFSVFESDTPLCPFDCECCKVSSFIFRMSSELWIFKTGF